MSSPQGRSEPACTYCGGWIEEGHLMDEADTGTTKPLRWLRGPLRKGAFGGAKTAFKGKFDTVAYRCVNCGHLELFVLHAGVPNQDNPTR